MACLWAFAALGVAVVLSAPLDGLPTSSLSSGHGIGLNNIPVWAIRTAKRSPERIQLCGYRLVEAVRVLCRGNFAIYKRRSDPVLSANSIGFGDDNGYLRESSSNSLDMFADANPPTSSGAEDKDGSWDSDVVSEQSDLFPWAGSSTRHQKSLVKSHQRFRRSIIDECCNNPCTISQMLKYCARN